MACFSTFSWMMSSIKSPVAGERLNSRFGAGSRPPASNRGDTVFISIVITWSSQGAQYEIAEREILRILWRKWPFISTRNQACNLTVAISEVWQSRISGDLELRLLEQHVTKYMHLTALTRTSGTKGFFVAPLRFFSYDWSKVWVLFSTTFVPREKQRRNNLQWGI